MQRHGFAHFSYYFCIKHATLRSNTAAVLRIEDNKKSVN